MDGDEEPTEMTAMTVDSRASTPDCREPSVADLAADDTRTSWDHSSAFVKRFVKTPKGMGIAAVVVIVVLIFIVLILAKIVTGSMHIGSCDLDPFVPIYMASSGALFLVFLAALLLVCLKCRHQGEDEGDDRVSPLHLLVLFYFFIHIVLQLAGSVCVIRARNDLQEQLGADLSTPALESTVMAQRTVKLDAPEVTPTYPLLEPVYVQPVKARPVQPPPTCSSDLLDFAFATVIVELVISGLFFIFIVASLLELAYIVYYEPSIGIKKTMAKANTRNSFVAA
ncbi:hypothetical protein ElyMa_004785600 [Elysia marginata]|uniref:MARVEL domain-containing protein n=1 Tax=Elysia marginata TaxID=1093978 RepID=A0AAV4II30_9GAST|nr:hypothetical protein ElyMa_004785600 [Elysia marginata]